MLVSKVQHLHFSSVRAFLLDHKGLILSHSYVGRVGTAHGVSYSWHKDRPGL